MFLKNKWALTRVYLSNGAGTVSCSCLSCILNVRVVFVAILKFYPTGAMILRARGPSLKVLVLGGSAGVG